MLALNEFEYLDMPGLSVLLGHDAYPEGHQGGVIIIQNGQRVAANGDLRLDRTPGQWQPVPLAGRRRVDRSLQEVSLPCRYPDPARNRVGFNPIEYPDLCLDYTLRIRPDGDSFIIRVDLEQPLSERWVGTVGFNLELFPGILFGRSYAMDGRVGIFPRQPNGPAALDAEGRCRLAPLATGTRLTVAPECDAQRMTLEALSSAGLELLDGREEHANGWFCARSLVPAGVAARAIEWRVSPHGLPGFRAEPTIQVSQVGFHPKQPKMAVIQLDARDPARPQASLERIEPAGSLVPVLAAQPEDWGRFLRYQCLRFDFTPVEEPGMYVVRYGISRSNPFQIGDDVFKRHVWQPALEYFLPIQMCHMRVNDRYRVWHGACHLDDARMAPAPHRHFDGYSQGPSTLCTFEPGQSVPGLARGGWHDAGDFDLRIESQIDTIEGLALAWETFGVDYDATTIDQERRIVEIGRPDGKPDILQQIEHGALSVVAGHRALGRPYRGIIEPTLRQYTLLGDPVNATDNVVFDAAAAPRPAPPVGLPGSPDDRWVFTEQNPDREIHAAAGLAAAARALRGFNDALAAECSSIAQELWRATVGDRPASRTAAAVELFIATGDREYADWLAAHRHSVCASVRRVGWRIARVLPQIGDADLTRSFESAARRYAARLRPLLEATPYGVPYRPRFWGSAWPVLRFAVQQYFWHSAFPNLFSDAPLLQALSFVLGCHPGDHPASFISGVGSSSVAVAYGLNRADRSYVPGGAVSGSALIGPDFIELLDWPFLWQQVEYVIGGGATDFLFLVLAADRLLARK